MDGQLLAGHATRQGTLKFENNHASRRGTRPEHWLVMSQPGEGAERQELCRCVKCIANDR